MTPTVLLQDWIRRDATPEGAEWLAQKRAEIAGGTGQRALAIAFGAVPRRLGKAALTLTPDDLAAAERGRPGWRAGGLGIDQAARILLLLDAAHHVPPLGERLSVLLVTADLGEAIAIYRGLPLYPDPAALVPIATEGLRTSVQAVFEAVAHCNPFPAEQFAQGAWNHMVLKALFVGSALYPIVGLDRRWNSELAQILIDYARERRAAGRPISHELWRGVGRFADAEAVGDLAALLASGTPTGQRAAALALAESPHPAATEALAARLDLADAVAAGDIGWDDVRDENNTPR